MIYSFNAGEVFKIALDIEENGRQFYEKAQKKTDDLAVKQIFQELGLEEIKHKEKFSELMAELPEATTGSTVWDPDNEVDQYLKMMADMHVFRKGDNVDKKLESVDNAEEALLLAIQFEKDSIVFFAEMQTLSEDKLAKDRIGQLVQEEQGHLKRLSLQLVGLGK